MAEGRYDSGVFYIQSVMHPPLHANKPLKFKLNESDYFGSYTKLTENMMIQAKLCIEAPALNKETNMEPCVVIIN